MNKKSRFSFYIFMITMAFFYLPLLVMILFSFNGDRGNKWAGFSMRWYESLFSNGQLWGAFLNSFIIAILSAATATLIGTLGAIGLQWFNIKIIKKYLNIITYLPLIIPELIIGVSMLMFFSKIEINLDFLSIFNISNSLINKIENLFIVFLAYTTFNIPFVLFIIMSRLEEFDYSVIDAAHDLGATEIKTLYKVIIPMIMPGIISGFLMAMTLSLDDFVITKFVSQDSSSMLPLVIFRLIKSGDSQVINALSVILVSITILLAIASKKVHKYLFK